jgi:hypothetical protein
MKTVVGNNEENAGASLKTDANPHSFLVAVMLVSQNSRTVAPNFVENSGLCRLYKNGIGDSVSRR